MALQLNSVAPRQGWQWVRQGVTLWWRKPMAFVGLAAFFLLAVTLIMSLVPVLGPLLGMGLVPMLSLGFMLASRNVLSGSTVHPLQLIDGLRHPVPSQRKAQWVLAALYAASALLINSTADWLDSGQFEALHRELAQAGADGKPSPALSAILADPRLLEGMLARLGLTALVSVPFWHAPALVHFGGQGALQALFTSTIALWRTRGAFAVYLLGWLGLMMAAAAMFWLLSIATGARQVLGVLTLPLGLAFSSAVYVSLWFSFADTFLATDASKAP